MIPKGKLIIIGGHEDKVIDGESLIISKRKECSPQTEILASLISKIPRTHHIIEIIVSASTIPETMEEMYQHAYKTAGFTHIGFIRIENIEEGNDISIIKRIEYCHAVFFTGGDQSRLTGVLNDTKVLKTIKKKYLADKNFIVAGTSAGAMAIPETIITDGIIREALMKGDVKTGKGLNFINNVIVDTHFVIRGRFARLAHAVSMNPSCLGIGLGEDTALTISNGNEAECTGSGMIIIIDGKEISKTNSTTVDECTPIIIENLKVHILSEGSKFLLTERKIQ